MGKTNLTARAALLAGGLLLPVSALAAGLLTNGIPPVGGSQFPGTLPLTGNETIPADTNLPAGISPQTESVPVGQVAGYMAGNVLSAGSVRNALIGGDFGLNLFQRGTNFANLTTATYTADRWFAWSAQAMQVSRDVVPTEVSANYSASLLFGRTSSTPAQVCVGQEVESLNSVQFDTSVAELDLHVTAGAGFSAANSMMQLYVVYGTGTDEGSTRMAFGVNGAGGGTSGWTGQVGSAMPVAVSGTNTRYTAALQVPATAREIGVAICYTPTGATTTNDYLAISGVQLSRNSLLAGLAAQGVGVQSSTVPAVIFGRRPAALEALLQQRYYWQISEGVTGTVYGVCEATSVTAGLCSLSTPTSMRVPPQASGLAGTLKLNVAGVQTAVTGLSAGVSSANALGLVTAATGQTAGQVEMLQAGGPAGGGVIAANSEL